MTTQRVATFELTAQANDPKASRRSDGVLVPCAEAHVALFAAVSAFQDELRRHGFPPATTSYGVRGEEFTSPWLPVPHHATES